jgi:uncharacterized protein
VLLDADITGSIPRVRRGNNVRRPTGSTELPLVRTASALALTVLAIVSAFGAGRVRAEGDSNNKIRIAFVGDSLSDGYWEGVSVTASRDPCLKTLIDFGRFAKNSTGLTRPDHFDWAAELKRVADSFKPRLFVMSLGLNDRQSVVEHGQITMDDSPQYDDKYKERITAVLKTAAAARASLLWVGLPAMRAAAADKDAREKNRLFEEAIQAFGDPTIQYVSPWKLNANRADAFASYGPDGNGRMVQIRTSDGEHFTVAGEMLTAVYLLPRIVANLAQEGVSACTRTEAQSHDKLAPPDAQRQAQPPDAQKQVQPPEVQPQEAQSQEARSQEAQSQEAQPQEAQPQEARSQEAQPEEAESQEAQSR